MESDAKGEDKPVNEIWALWCVVTADSVDNKRLHGKH
jgi:hypothetical protein